MKIPSQYDLNNYYFELPQELIAQFPREKRTESRLLVLNRKSNILIHSYFKDICDFLPEQSIIVVNDSKVFPARIFGKKKDTEGKVEFLLTTPIPLIKIERDGSWSCAVVHGLLRPSKGLKAGKKVIISDDFFFVVKSKGDFGQAEVMLFWQGDLKDKLRDYGSMPLPPYIKRNASEIDIQRYQTIYSREEKLGSIAAPTAGLHFSKDLLEDIQIMGIEIVSITLYVGYGTFSPVRCQDIRQHKMHSEYVEVSKESAGRIKKALEKGKKLIAVGTTTVRTLEGIAKIYGDIKEYKGVIDLYIYPGFKFKIIDHLITNFHLPKSSLLLLVSAFAGREKILNAYQEAVNNKYKFFSYGDAMLIL